MDANREALELDPDMYHDDLPSGANTRSPRVAAGIGTIARVVTGDRLIYDQKLSFNEVRHRIEACYHPYHEALKGLVDTAMAQFGTCLMVDSHSMPSGAGDGGTGGGPGHISDHDAIQSGAYIILGDC